MLNLFFWETGRAVASSPAESAVSEYGGWTLTPTPTPIYEEAAEDEESVSSGGGGAAVADQAELYRLVSQR